MSFEVGDLVVCVNAEPCPVYGAVLLRKGGVYRLIEVRSGADSNTGFRGTGCILDRDNNPQGRGRWASLVRFRKLNDTPDDIKLVRAIKDCKPILVPSEEERSEIYERLLGVPASPSGSRPTGPAPSGLSGFAASILNARKPA